MGKVEGGRERVAREDGSDVAFTGVRTRSEVCPHTGRQEFMCEAFSAGSWSELSQSGAVFPAKLWSLRRGYLLISSVSPGLSTGKEP